jgi:hypothetical protein
MIEAALSEFLGRAYKSVSLAVTTANTSAFHLYESCGFPHHSHIPCLLSREPLNRCGFAPERRDNSIRSGLHLHFATWSGRYAAHNFDPRDEDYLGSTRNRSFPAENV